MGAVVQAADPRIASRLARVRGHAGRSLRRCAPYRSAALVAVVVLCVVASTGCLDATARIEVHDEQSATVVVDVVPDRERWDALGGQGTAGRVAESVRHDAAPRFTAEKIQGERTPGIRLTWSDAPIDALTQPIPYAGGQFAPLFEKFQMVHADDGSWQLEAVVAPVTPIANGVAARFPASADETVIVKLSIEMPGRVVATNAEEHDRSSATWNLDARSSAATAIDMRSEPGLGINPVVFLVAGLVLLIGLGVLMVVWSDRLRVRQRLRHAATVAVADHGKGATRPTGPAAPPSRRRRRLRLTRRYAGNPGGRGGGGAAVADAGSVPKGMYQDVSGDQTVALPVGGSSWGPAPPELGNNEIAGGALPADPGASEAVTPEAIAPDSSGTPVVYAIPTVYAVPSESDGPSVYTVVPPASDGRPASEAPMPVSEPVAPRSSTVIPPGWYPDPERPEGRRFWNGTSWTDHRA